MKNIADFTHCSGVSIFRFEQVNPAEIVFCENDIFSYCTRYLVEMGKDYSCCLQVVATFVADIEVS